MGSGRDRSDEGVDAEGHAHDALTCRPFWARHGRFHAWELCVAGVPDDRVVELPDRELELLPCYPDAGHLPLPLWTNGIWEAVPIVMLAEEDLARIWRHLGAAALARVVWEALVVLRNEMRDRHLELVPEDDDGAVWAAIADEERMPPRDEVILVGFGRPFAVELPHHVLNQFVEYEPEPRLKDLVSWPRSIARATARYGEWLDQRAGRDVPYQPSPARPYFSARPLERPAPEEARQWLDEELFPRVFPSARWAR